MRVPLRPGAPVIIASVIRRRIAIACGVHVGNDSGWEIAIDLVAGLLGHAGVLILGWGWDATVPLRPWPRTWWSKATPRGNVTSGIAWCGLFATVGTRP